MTKIFYESDANLDILNDKTVGVLGYGSQGHAHALNLKDSGINVVKPFVSATLCADGTPSTLNKHSLAL